MSNIKRDVFHPSPFRQGVFVAIWLVLAAPFLFGGIAMREEGMIVVGVFVSLLLAPVSWFVVFQVRLVFTDEGIVLRNYPWNLETSWDNVSEFYRQRGKEGFILLVPMESKGADNLARSVGREAGVNNAIYRGGHPELAADRRFIPIEPFGFWLRHGRLADVVAKHRPDLVA
ncbi:MAG: hypothetical protein KDB22_27440 [Planctomycetales bacterium]|nr:hypothetical protein [Planctomycetales bacterium]